MSDDTPFDEEPICGHVSHTFGECHCILPPNHWGLHRCNGHGSIQRHEWPWDKAHRDAVITAVLGNTPDELTSTIMAVFGGLVMHPDGSVTNEDMETVDMPDWQSESRGFPIQDLWISDEGWFEEVSSDEREPTGPDEEEPPAPTQAIGPTEHLDTVEYWRQLYIDAVQMGQEMLDRARADKAESPPEPEIPPLDLQPLLDQVKALHGHVGVLQEARERGDLVRGVLWNWRHIRMSDQNALAKLCEIMGVEDE